MLRDCATLQARCFEELFDLLEPLSVLCCACLYWQYSDTSLFSSSSRSMVVLLTAFLVDSIVKVYFANLNAPIFGGHVWLTSVIYPWCCKESSIKALPSRSSSGVLWTDEPCASWLGETCIFYRNRSASAMAFWRLLLFLASLRYLSPSNQYFLRCFAWRTALI